MAEDKNVIEEIKTGFASITTAFKEWRDSLKTEKFGAVKTKDGKVIDYPGTELKEGITAKFGDEAVPDGDYTLENGDTCKIEGGVIKEFKKKEQEPAVQSYSKEEMDEKFSALEKSNTESLDKLSQAITALLTNNEKTLEVVEKFAAQAKEPALKKTGMTGTPEVSGADKAAERAARLQKMQGLTS